MILFFNDFTLEYKSYTEIEFENDSFIIRQSEICLNRSSGGTVYIPEIVDPTGDGNKYFSILIKELIKIEYRS